MMKPKPTPNLTIYLLHFDQPVASKRHYSGIAATSRLEQRWREHASGRGASLTKLAAETGIGFTVTALIQNASFKKERTIKRSWSLARSCPACRDRPYQTTIEGVGRHFDAVKPVYQWSATGWPTKDETQT